MVATQPALRRDDVARILSHVDGLGAATERPALAVLAGLPASGKSRIAAELRARTGAVVLESDAIRRLLFPRRTYSALESRRLFAAIHAALERLLADRRSVVLDATNIAESERVPLYEIARRAGARLVLVQVTAPEATLRLRLARRQAAGGSLSEAGLRVYDRLRGRAEAIERPHHVIDTSQKLGPALAAIAKEMLQP